MMCRDILKLRTSNLLTTPMLKNFLKAFSKFLRDKRFEIVKEILVRYLNSYRVREIPLSFTKHLHSKESYMKKMF